MCQEAAVFERVATATDQDRGRHTGQRRQIEKVLADAQFLGPGDRLLIRQVFEFGLKVADIALQARCGRNTIYRRLRSILARLRSPLFLFAAGHRDVLRPELRQVADLVILQGLTQRQACQLTGQSLHTVRRHLHALATLASR